MPNIYIHNPRCSKSRQGLELLDKNGLSYEVKEYLKEPLTKTELSKLYSLLNKNYSVAEFTRTKEKSFNSEWLIRNESESSPSGTPTSNLAK